MRTSRFKTLIQLSLFLLVFSACNQSNPTEISQSTPPQESESTNQVFQVLELNPTISSTSAILEPTLTSTEIPTLPTETSATVNAPISSTASPTTISDTPTPECLNQAEFVKNLNLGDYTQLKTGEAFAKVWRIKNIGTCTWTADYKLIFLNGMLMNSPDHVFIPHAVLPGETVDLRVGGVAPIIPDEYESDWIFQDEKGNVFGIGDNAEEPLAIRIIVTQYSEELDPNPGPT